MAVKVKFLGAECEAQINFGGCNDPRGVLQVGKIYDLEKKEVRSYHTKYFLSGIKGCFNSVMFERVGD